MQILDAKARQSIPGVMRWYNTIISHPNIAEFVEPIGPAPATSLASSYSTTNGIPEGQAARGGEASTSQSSSHPTSQSASGTAAESAPLAADQKVQGKPTGKDAKGGKLAKNDVAKGQKKGGAKKEKPSQAPKGNADSHYNISIPEHHQHVAQIEARCGPLLAFQYSQTGEKHPVMETAWSAA